MPSCDIAFVAVNFNTRELVEELVAFFRKADLPFSHRLVVVDNGSSDGSNEFLHSCADIVHIPAGKNLGYGRAMNVGLRSVESRYVCILNTDVILNREALMALWEFLESHPAAGLAAPVIRYPNGRIQGFLFCHSLLSYYVETAGKVFTKYSKLRLSLARGPLPVQGVMGAFFVIRRSVIPVEGLFDEKFFFYFEDTDLAHRLYKQGVPCHVLPGVSIIHMGGQSTSVEGGRMYHASRSIYLAKHFGVSHACRIKRLELCRLRVKRMKYAFLSRFSGSQRVKSKLQFYERLTQELRD